MSREFEEKVERMLENISNANNPALPEKTRRMFRLIESSTAPLAAQGVALEAETALTKALCKVLGYLEDPRHATSEGLALMRKLGDAYEVFLEHSRKSSQQQYDFMREAIGIPKRHS